MKTAKDVLKAIKDNDVKYVDFRFTDPRGKWQHVTFDVSIVDEDIFAEGMMFDGSSIAGWKAINESDMTLMPDPATAQMDPFFSAADHVDRLRHPRAGDRRALQPRSARHGQEGRGLPEVDRHRRHRSIVGPEAEFFVFDDVRFMADPYNTGFKLDSIRAADQRRHGLRGRQPRPPHPDQGRLLPGPAAGLRAGHARRDARRHGGDGREGREAPPRGRFRPARARHEVRHADADGRPDADLQVLHPQRRPEPTARRRLSCRSRSIGDNGSGMHVHQSIWKGGKPVFAGNKYCRPVAGMPLVHRRHHQARQGAERLHQPVDELLQAARPGLRGAGAAGLFGPQPLGLLPHPVDDLARRPSASRSASPIRRRTPTSPSRRC